MEMSVNKKFDPAKVSIIEIKFIKGQIDADELYSLNSVKEYKIKNDLQLAFNVPEKLAKSELQIDIETISNNSNNNEARGNFHIIFIFRIDNLEELASLNKDNLVDLDPQLHNALVSITYSTSRGLLFNKVLGTPLEKFILPVINPNTLIE